MIGGRSGETESSSRNREADLAGLWSADKKLQRAWVCSLVVGGESQEELVSRTFQDASCESTEEAVNVWMLSLQDCQVSLYSSESHCKWPNLTVSLLHWEISLQMTKSVMTTE